MNAQNCSRHKQITSTHVTIFHVSERSKQENETRTKYFYAVEVWRHLEITILR